MVAHFIEILKLNYVKKKQSITQILVTTIGVDEETPQPRYLLDQARRIFLCILPAPAESKTASVPGESSHHPSNFK